MCGGYPEYFFFFNDTATTEIYTFPYTTLFRSHEIEAAGKPLAGGRRGHLAAGPHRPGLHVDRFTPAAQEVGQLLVFRPRPRLRRSSGRLRAEHGCGEQCDDGGERAIRDCHGELSSSWTGRKHTGATVNGKKGRVRTVSGKSIAIIFRDRATTEQTAAAAPHARIVHH